MLGAGIRPRHGTILAWDNGADLIEILRVLPIRRFGGEESPVGFSLLDQVVLLIHEPIGLFHTGLAGSLAIGAERGFTAIHACHSVIYFRCKGCSGWVQGRLVLRPVGSFSLHVA